MQITKSHDDLKVALSDIIRRQYPLVYNQNLTEQYNNLTLPENMAGILTREPWIEALPKYQPLEGGLETLKHKDWLGDNYSDFLDFLINQRDKGIGGIFNPYLHQAEAIKAWSEGKDLVVSTGTGSGKTECFIWPILGHLWKYARTVEKEKEPSSHRGVKAMVLYPMNALVADQLKRMRGLFGNITLAQELSGDALFQGGESRFFQFGQYTGRTKFFGSYAKPTYPPSYGGDQGQGQRNPKIGQNGSARRFIQKYVSIEDGGSTGPDIDDGLYMKMMKMGLIPSKGNNLINDEGSIYSSLRDYEDRGENNTPLLTHHLDRELLMRHEMHNVGYQHLLDGRDGDPIIGDDDHFGGTPDILITNYSMLEYMIKRPLEHIIWHDTAEWLREDEENKLLLILDEAHLYQGALGTEVGMLIRRLFHSVGIEDPENKVQMILTSASLGDNDLARKNFTMGLTGRSQEWMDEGRTEFITGTDWEIPDDWTNIEIDKLELIQCLGGEGDLNASSARLALHANKICPDDFEFDDDWGTDIKRWADWFKSTNIYRELYELMKQGVLSLNDLSERFLGQESAESIRAMERLLNFVATLKTTDQVGRPNFPLLGIRAHLLFRGLPNLFWSIASNNLKLRDGGSGDEATYPVKGCRACGAPFINAWVPRNEMTRIRTALNGEGQNTIRTHTRPIVDSVRIEIYLAEEIDEEGGSVNIGGEVKRISNQQPHIWVHKYRSSICTRGYPDLPEVRDNWNQDDWHPGYLVTNNEDEVLPESEEDEREAFGAQLSKLSFTDGRCPQCNSNHQPRRALQITDYMTRGDQAFAKLAAALHATQDEDTSEATRGLPNRGKKVLIFSDGRQRASKLAKAVQDASNNDEFRNLLMHLLHDEWYSTFSKYTNQSVAGLYSFLVLHLSATNREPFEQTASKFSNPREIFARNRRKCLAIHIAGLTHLHLTGVDLGLEHRDNLLNNIIDSTLGALGEREKLEAQSVHFVEGAPTIEIDLNDIREWWERNKNYRRSVENLSKDAKGFITKKILSDVENNFIDVYFGVIVDYCVNVEEEGHNNQNYRINPEDFRQKVSELLDADEQDEGLLNQDTINTMAERWNEWIQIPQVDYEWSRNNAGQESGRTAHLLRLNHHQIVFRTRINVIRDEQQNPLQDLEIKSTMTLNNEYPSLADYSEIAQSIKRTELRIFNRERGRIKESILNNTVVRAQRIDEQGPNVYYQTIIDFLSSKDFSLNNLGLAHITVLDSDIDNIVRDLQFDKLNDDDRDALKIVLSELIRWPLRRKRSSENVYDKKWRCILSEGEKFGHRNARNHPAGKWLPSAATDWAVTLDNLENAYLRYCSEYPDNLLEDGQPRVSLGRIINQTQLFLREGGEHYGTNANKIRLVSVVLQPENIYACSRCGIVTSHPYEVNRGTCADCDDNETLVPYNPEQNDLLKQRIEGPWRRPAIAAVESNDDNLVVTIIRAEEHTAQINDNRDVEEMFTAAEKFELLFQDVPFVVPEGDDRWSLPESPIDILSCTTTMEVGIDIGSLTAVALRTVPRERANYQQRVGRAGRGKSEVCIALSWYDNIPYAQHYFSNPEEILSHPETSPIIYLENEEIVKRHVWAAILQSFFKRKRFIREERQFEGMEPELSNANLMDSMGTVDDFYALPDDAGSYSLSIFKRWLDGDGEDNDVGIWEDIKGPIISLIPEGMDNELFDTWLEELIGELNQNQPAINVEGDE